LTEAISHLLGYSKVYIPILILKWFQWLPWWKDQDMIELLPALVIMLWCHLRDQLISSLQIT
jgi:hypothetical protein